MLEQTGFVDVEIGPPVDTFGGAPGEDKARTYDVHGYAFLAGLPSGSSGGHGRSRGPAR